MPRRATPSHSTGGRARAKVPVPAELSLPALVDGNDLELEVAVGGQRVRAQLRTADEGGYPEPAAFSP
jgi:hypothetical protein